jgi:hypothetical protein
MPPDDGFAKHTCVYVWRDPRCPNFDPQLLAVRQTLAGRF